VPTRFELEYRTPQPHRNRAFLVFAVVIHAMTSRTGRRVLVAVTCATTLLIAAGYLSNSLCSTTCEIRTAKWFAATVYSGKPFCLGPDGKVESQAIFASAGIPTSQNATGLPYPWGEVRRAHSVAPFLVEVDYGWVAEPQIGEGGSLRYFCFFGYIIEIGDRVRWVT
jgi:hypothetical protein